MSASRHPGFTVFLHWLSAILLALVVALVFGRDLVDSRAVSRELLDLHRSAGMAILVFAGWRLLRQCGVLGKRSQPHAEPVGALSALAARATHAALYGLLLALPILGWAQTSAHGKPVHLLGVIPLPALLARNRDLAETLQGWHENLAWVLFALIGVHVVAALWHHFVARDSVLVGMLPRRAASRA